MESGKNQPTNNAEKHNDVTTILDCSQQLKCLVVGIIISVFIIFCVGYVVYAICSAKGSETYFLNILTISAVGGTFGGSVRALMMLIFEVGLKKDDKPIDFYLSRWPLYLFKPIVGCGTGILFFFSINFGFVKPLEANQSTPKLLPIFFISAVGGIFFEEVIAILGRFITKFSQENKRKAL